MTRAQFLNDLYRRLGGLTQEQAEQHLTYYAEMLADRMEEGMSEEEAVASMEPVDVIAQRILQDEGIDPDTVRPPQYPDLPKSDGARFTKVPDLPKKKDRRKIGMAVLWVVAVVMAVSAVGRWLASHSASGDTTAEEAVPIDQTDYGYYEEPDHDWDIEFVDLEDLWSLYIGPDGIAGNNFSVSPEGIYVTDGEHELYVGPEGFSMGNPTEIEDEMIGARYRFEDDTCRLSEGEADEINIDWTNGIVKVRGWDEEYIQFQEFSNVGLKQSQKLEFSVDGAMLNISDGAGLDKGLIVWVPTHLLDYLYVKTSTADVYCDQLTAESGQIYTTTGSIVLSNSAFNGLTANSSSGGITMRGIGAGTLSAEATSGDVYLDAVMAEELGVSTSSGNVSGFLTGNYASIGTTSGKISVKTAVSGQLSLNTSSGAVDAALQDAAPYQVYVDTTSGNVILRMPELWGFELSYDSSSGHFSHGPFDVVRMYDRYVAEGYPATDIIVDTTSGNLQLESNGNFS